MKLVTRIARRRAMSATSGSTSSPAANENVMRTARSGASNTSTIARKMSDSVMMPTSTWWLMTGSAPILWSRIEARRVFDRRVGRRDARLVRHEISRRHFRGAGGASSAARLSAALTANGLMIGRKCVQHVRMGDDAEKAGSFGGCADDRQSADLALAHESGDLRERRARGDGQDVARHPHADEHGATPYFLRGDFRKPSIA